MLLLITGMEGDLFIAARGLAGACKAAEVGLVTGGWILSLELLGVLLGDLTVTCLDSRADVGGVGARIGALEEVGVVGIVVDPFGGDTSALRLGDLPICDCGVVGALLSPRSSGSFKGGIL